MTTHRFNGVPINVDRLNDEELHNLADYTRQRVATAAGELALLDTYLQPTQEFPAIPVTDIQGFKVEAPTLFD